MAKVRTEDGKSNIVGAQIKILRKGLANNVSQRELAEILQRFGLDIDKNAIQRIEAGKRCVKDIELQVIAEVFEVQVADLLG